MLRSILLKLFKTIKHRIEQKYYFIHIKLIHVTIKPLTRNVLKASILLYLRNGRHNKFHDSLIGMVEYSIFQRHVYLDYYLNYSLSLFNVNITQVLILNIKTSNYHMMK